MALAPLASADDLAARNIVTPDGVDVDKILASVSDSIRDAAGVPITQTTSTVAVPIFEPTKYLDLPGPPVVSVATVLVGGVAVTDWAKVGDELYRACGWGCVPSEVTVTYTHGYVTVPADIVDLVCAFTSLAFAASEDVYGEASRTESESLGDYKRSTYRLTGVSELQNPSPVNIPHATRIALRARFGGGSAVVGVGRH
jgi:hypothetical protein